jgi:hypothetical protein
MEPVTSEVVPYSIHLKLPSGLLSSRITLLSQKKSIRKRRNSTSLNKRELLLEIDFGGDAPALRNEFKACLTSSLLDGSSIVDAPDWFRADADKKKFAQLLRVSYDNATASDQMHAACRAVNCRAVNFVQFACIPEANVGGEYLSDEAIESIGREDYVRMVACLGQKKADKYFEEVAWHDTCSMHETNIIIIELYFIIIELYFIKACLVSLQ